MRRAQRHERLDSVERVSPLCPMRLTWNGSTGRSSEFAACGCVTTAARTATLTAASGSSTSSIFQPRRRAYAVRPEKWLACSVDWEGEGRARLLFELGWLAAHAVGALRACPKLAVRQWLEGAQWMRTATSPGRASDGLHQDERGRALRWLTGLVQAGLAFIERCARATGRRCFRAVALVGRVLGDQLRAGSSMSVRCLQPENLAYSDLGLGLHTDNPYREPVPGFQALHVLLASPDGGESLFADGHAPWANTCAPSTAGGI